jgi:rSAM/selenodomain-associated transferase 1
VPDLLLLFLKWPEPGLAKTRLIPALGPETAAAVYRLLAEAEVAATRPGAGEYDRLFCFSPAAAEAQVRAWFPGEAVWPQPEGDLGHRMASAFGAAFARGANRVALVGTDIPGVTRDLVARSFDALAAADLVLGPTHDGGYYLVAMARPLPELFEGMEWSTTGVLAATRERAEALGLGTRLVRPLTDIDTLDDLRATWDEIDPLLGREPEVRDAVARALALRPGGARFGAQ